MTASTTPPNGSTVDQAEVARFSALAAEWWNPRGKMGVLHKFNPVRLGFIKEAACRRFGRDAKRLDCLAGLRILDIGCGGGLLCEPLARLGAAVTGIDLAAASIEAAAGHARAAGLTIDYRIAGAQELVAERARFDLVCAMEVVEHVADPAGFLTACAALVRPGGGLVLATLNRTFRAFALGIVAAEYVLGWLPRGTHQWSRFLRPSEAARPLRWAGLRIDDLTGVVYDPLRDRFRLSRDCAVNYMLFATRS
jgi:2-polyprenyl-6-hydroxyphenyl methylase / 3-demethylubiquinone-9 3-methyltransferase